MAGLSKIGGEPFIKPPGMKLLSLKCTVFHYVRVSKRKVRWEMGYDFRSNFLPPNSAKNAKVLETSFANRMADPEAQQNAIDKYI